jgi:hypothetical protein
MEDVFGLLEAARAGDRVAYAILADILEEAGSAGPASYARDVARGQGAVAHVGILATGFEWYCRQAGLIP